MNTQKEQNNTKFIYKIQFYLLKGLFKTFNLLGFRYSSFLMSCIAVVFGIFTPPTFLAFRNIRRAMPELTFFQVLKTIVGMWSNLGSYVAEYCNVYDKNEDIFKYATLSEKSKKMLKKIKNDKRGAILFSGHIANWEVGLRVMKELGVPVKTVYRPLNNKLTDKFTNDFRRNIGVDMIAKGGSGAVKIVKEIKKGTKIVMLVDQRISSGVKVPFFDRTTFTTDAIAVFALKYKIPVYPVRVIRKDVFSNFEFVVEDEMKIKATKNREKDIVKITTKVNEKLEEWIKEYPSQWFWVHNRWRMTI